MKFIKSAIKFFFEELALFIMFDIVLLLLIALWYNYNPAIFETTKSKPVSPLSFTDNLIIGIPGIIFFLYLVWRKHFKTDSR